MHRAVDSEGDCHVNQDGRWGSSRHHERTIEKIPATEKRWRRHWCCYNRNGSPTCKQPMTHFGKANGVVLVARCEFHARVWVRDGR